MNAVFLCPKCGTQNFIAEERFELLDEVPFRCWRCDAQIPKGLILEHAARGSPVTLEEETVMGEEIIVYVTAGSEEEAARIARSLLEDRLIACANIVPKVRSIYRWKGKVCDEPEALMLLKSVKRHFSRLVERVRELHSYEVPEIIACGVSAGHQAYLDWVREETS